MKDVKVTIGEMKCALLFNGRAMFALREIYETESEMFEVISQQDGKGFNALCEMVRLLAEQGEMARRYEGYDPQEILSAEQIGLIASPLDCIAMKNAVLQAVLKGFGRDIEEIEKDLGLAEIEQKKTIK